MTSASVVSLAPSDRPPAHPYHPQDLSITNYAPNTMPLGELFSRFLFALGGYLILAYVVAIQAKPRFRHAPFSDKAVFVWFTMCGGLHWFFEGYFVLHHASLAGEQSLRAQLWKEYALSDSRYLTSDSFMLCVEGLTVVVHGTLSFAVAVAIMNGASLSTGSAGLRHVLQTVVSTAHLFGVLLYYGTLLFQEALQGTSHCRPEFLYRWVYFGAMNAPWVVVPVYILYSSASQICQVFAAANRVHMLDANELEQSKDK